MATGFNGWGISNGTAVGLGMARQIITGRCPWKQLYDPNRPSPDDFNQSSDSQTRVDDLNAHGSIFQADGEVIHGPAIEPLAARSL